MPAVTVRSRPNGLPIATTGSPTRIVSELPSCSGVSARELASTLRTARSLDGSEPTTVAFMLAPFEKLTLIFLRALDDVVVRDDVARLVDHEAGAERLLLLLAREEVAEERVGRDGDDRGRRHLDDAARGALVDVADRERLRRNLAHGRCRLGRDLADSRRLAAEIAERGRSSERDAAAENGGRTERRSADHDALRAHAVLIARRC